MKPLIEMLCSPHIVILVREMESNPEKFGIGPLSQSDGSSTRAYTRWGELYYATTLNAGYLEKKYLKRAFTRSRKKALHNAVMKQMMGVEDEKPQAQTDYAQAGQNAAKSLVASMQQVKQLYQGTAHAPLTGLQQNVGPIQNAALYQQMKAEMEEQRAHNQQGIA